MSAVNSQTVCTLRTYDEALVWCHMYMKVYLAGMATMFTDGMVVDRTHTCSTVSAGTTAAGTPILG